ncbi:MAG: TrkH family potassium uptake protein, partial [Pseudomonadales bacterium]|nr:TrkH family potassium uptake protein [Pseudomonadales bacterium]
MFGLFRPAMLVVGYLLLAMAGMMLVSMAVVHHPFNGQGAPLLFAAVITGGAGLVPLVLGRIDPGTHTTYRQIFLITVTSWTVVPLFGALPFFLSGELGFVDSVFESVSGITTTGSTVLVGLDTMPEVILFWRSVLQWLGGIGIIAMAAAVLPLLKVGGMRLFRTESSDWSEKAMPRARQIYKALLIAYVLLSVLCGFAYWVAGMDWFDAINHAATTISTGGFSTSDASMGQFDSLVILWISTVFMAAGGVPFLLYARFLSDGEISVFKDEQVMGYVKFLSVASLVIGGYLVVTQDMSFLQAITRAAFNVTSIVTTTGYASEDYTLWGSFAIAMFLFLTMVGGCSGSTAGGMKIFRFQLCFMFLQDHLTKLIHPHVVVAKKYNGRPLPDDIVTSAVAFSFLFFMALAACTIALAAMGLDLVTSFSAAATALTNVGPGL